MKKIRSIAAIIAASLTLASCGLGTTGTGTNSTGNTGNAGNTQNGSIMETAGGLLGTILGSLLGNMTSQQSLVGSWTYYGPKIVFESENILSQLGGQVVTNSLESKLGDMLSKIGLKAGKSVLTLNRDGSCTFVRNGKSLNGTYVYDSSTNKLSLTGVLGLGQMTCTVSVQSGQLYMLFDTDKLLSLFSSAGSKDSGTFSSLLKNYKGLKLGWTMTRQ